MEKNSVKQIDAKIKVLQARIGLLKALKEDLQAVVNLNRDGWFLAADFAKSLGVSRQYISNNKEKYQSKIYEGREYFKRTI